MPSELADWIDSHHDCRHNLGTSGMLGSIEPPRPTAREVRAADPGTGNPGGETTTGGHLGIGLGVDYAIDRRLVVTLHALTGYTVGAQVWGWHHPR